MRKLAQVRDADRDRSDEIDTDDRIYLAELARQWALRSLNERPALVTY